MDDFLLLFIVTAGFMIVVHEVGRIVMVCRYGGDVDVIDSQGLAGLSLNNDGFSPRGLGWGAWI